MSHEQFKLILHRDKQFLKELFDSDSIVKSKRILNFANDTEINTLAKYLHYISNGEIPIKKQNFDALKKKHLSFVKRSFEKKQNLQKFLQQQRKEKNLILSKLLSALPSLLTPLFRE